MLIRRLLPAVTALALTTLLAGCGSSDGERRLRRPPRRRGVLPAGLGDRAGGRADLAGHQPDRPRHRAARPLPRHRPDRRHRPGRPGGARAGLPARRRRHGRDQRGAGRHRRRGRRDRPDAGLRARPRGGRRRATTTATSTRTSGSTRCSWPTSATRSPTSCPSSTPPAQTTYAAERRRPARATSSRSTATSPRSLATCERTTTVVSHEAFGYLARYGLHFEAIAGLSPDAEPTPADLARLAGAGRGGTASPRSSPSGWPARRCPTPSPPTSASTTAVLDPIEGLSDQTADEDYLSLMAREPHRPADRRTGARA